MLFLGFSVENIKQSKSPTDDIEKCTNFNNRTSAFVNHICL